MKDENVKELENFVDYTGKRFKEDDGTSTVDKFEESLDELGNIMEKAFEAKRKVFSKGVMTGIAIGCLGTVAGYVIGGGYNKSK